MNISTRTKKKIQSRYGSWALVTGASSGIGKAIAEGLAASGMNVIITARSGLALAQLAETIEITYAVQTKIITADLSIATEVNELLVSIEQFPVGLAVFAAGYGTSGAFINANIDEELDMLSVNCKALLMGVHHFTQYFQQRGKGGMVLLSSIVGFQGSPNVAHYAATKAYVQSLGEALAVELKPDNIDVLTVAPGPVHTGFADRASLQMDVAATPEIVAKSVINALGKKNTLFPGTLAKAMILGLRMFPRWIKIRIMNKVMGRMAHG